MNLLSTLELALDCEQVLAARVFTPGFVRAWNADASSKCIFTAFCFRCVFVCVVF